MKLPTRLILAALIPLLGAPLWAASKAVVIVPVADLRSEPSMPPLGLSDDKQQTQLLFGETVEVVSSSGEWVRVNAIEQPSYKYHQRWEGYPGWVLSSNLKITDEQVGYVYIAFQKWLLLIPPLQNESITRLPLGSRIRYIEESHMGPPLKPVAMNGNITTRIDLYSGHTGLLQISTTSLNYVGYSEPRIGVRKTILISASKLIGDPYVWGGLSPFDETHQTRLSGVDCSGLVHLAYRVNGITVPRDSVDQYLKAEKIKRADLKPADLIFSANLDNPKKIVHVMLYAGGDDVIEAPRTGETVHRTTFTAKTGVPLSSVESGQKLKDRVVYFGRLLKD